MVGRKHKPTKIHKLNGNPSRKNLDTGEPEPENCIPACPSILKGQALEEWQRVTKELFKLGLISELDRGQLAIMCQAWGEYCDYTKLIEKHGAIFKAPRTGYPVIRPFVSMARNAADRYIKISIEFGMSPSSRARLGTGVPKSDEADPLERLLSSGAV